jgi:transaldolase
MMTRSNPLLRARALGQSIWLDYIRRGMLLDGTLARMIRDDGLGGMTSNPAIFEKAIAHGEDYDATIAALASTHEAEPLYEAIAIEDVQNATDTFSSLYRETRCRDGYVSLEVSPHLADDTDRTIDAARRLWSRVARPNVMIKVPGTRAGLPAITQLIADGVNVNVTLLFSVERYAAVAEAWLAGLETRARLARPLDTVASVASFFLSRIDTLVDEKLDALTAGDPQAARLRGQAAIASARLAYQRFKDWRESERWRLLAERSALPQRLLWASTSTKDPRYPDVMYVDALIGPETVNTVPVETLEAYRDHGDPQIRIEDDLDTARALPRALAALGIDLEAVAHELERQGVAKFVKPYDSLIAAIEKQRIAVLGD